ncbi:MAG: hypothetical protein Q4B54_12925, partial [Coriobacteriales bacterium]|nr:hypothetical protein [Coriobacteriales bacterium]
KWYKFIIYVQCFLGGLSGVVSGLNYVLGLQYGDNVSQVYGYFPSMKTVDVIYGIVNIVVGILLVYARFRLKNFKANSISIYLFLPLVNAISTIIYLIAVSNVLHASLFSENMVSSSTFGLIVGNVILFVANYIYFGHRKHLFNEA